MREKIFLAVFVFVPLIVFGKPSEKDTEDKLSQKRGNDMEKSAPVVNHEFTGFKLAWLQEQPANSIPLQDIEKVSGGKLSALGTFDDYDERPADGGASTKVFFEAKKAGKFSVKFVQLFKIIDHRKSTAEKTIYSQEGKTEKELTINIVDSASRSALEYDFEKLPKQVELSVRTKLILTVNMGLASRGGTEITSPIYILKK